MSAAAFVGGPVGAALDPLMAGLMDANLAGNSYLPVETLSGASPSDALSNILTSHLQSIGSAPMPFSGEITQYMAPLMSGAGSMSFVNAGDQSSAEALNDSMQVNRFVAVRWPDGSERTLHEGVPIFAYHSNLRVTPPGWAVVASPVKINDVQLKLAELERTVAFHGVASEADDPRRMRYRAQNSLHAHATVGSPMINVSAVDSEELNTHRYWGSTTVQGLYEKLSYVGPVAGIHARENGSHSAQWRAANTFGETYITHAFGTRARIHNMFSTAPELGEQFYFSLGKYERDDLLAVGYKQVPSFSSDFVYSSASYGGYGTKRGYSDISSAYVTTPERNDADGNSVVQVRGWASRTGQQWLPKTSPIDTMKPNMADRFYVERERRAAVEWIDTDVDPQTGELRIVKTLAEGVQEAVANLPSIVIENYLESVYIFSVGHVKGYKNPDSTAAAIHNAHYDIAALASQPLIEIYMAN